MKNKQPSGTKYSMAVGFVPLFSGLLISAGCYATDVIDEFSVEVPESCSLSSTVDTAHDTNIKVGQYRDDIGETSFNVFCNDAEGFSVYSVGYSGNSYGNTIMLPTNNSLENAIATGLASSGEISNWAMKLTSVSENFTLFNGFGSYHAVPEEYTKVASYPSNTTTTTGVQIKSTYATYISSAQVADTYTGKVKYTVVHPSSKEIETKNITDLTYLQDFANLNFEEKEMIIGSMQNNTTYNLVDNRDDKIYQIAKLKDGNVWMVDNLDLGSTPLTTDLTSSNTNLGETVTATTFNSWKKDAILGTKTDGEFVQTSGTDAISNTKNGSLYNYHAASAGTLSGYENTENAIHDICPAGWRMPSYGTSGEYDIIRNLYSIPLLHSSIADGGAGFAFSGNIQSSINGGAPDSQGSRGVYWASNSAGKTSMDRIFITDTSVTTPGYYGGGGRAEAYSIRCILKNNTSSFTISMGTGVDGIIINDAYVPNNSTIQLEVGTTVLVNLTTPHYKINSWTVTSNTTTTSNTSQFNYTISSSDAKLTASTTYIDTPIQNLGSSTCTSSPIVTYDTRDNHVYTVQRLADSGCWMMDNLDLGRTNLTSSLTSANTNLETTITAETFNSWKNTNYLPLKGMDQNNGVSFGTLYNYYATSAGTISSNTDNSVDVLYDICPAGWQLPDVENNTNLLFDNYTPSALLQPLANNGANMTLAGTASYKGIVSKQNQEGYYWTSSKTQPKYKMAIVVSEENHLKSSNIHTALDSIRCVLKESQ